MLQRTMSVEFLTEWPPPPQEASEVEAVGHADLKGIKDVESKSENMEGLMNADEIKRLENILGSLRDSSLSQDATSLKSLRPLQSSPSRSLFPARTAVSLWWKQQCLSQPTSPSASVQLSLNTILLETRTKTFIVEALVSLLKQRKKHLSSSYFFYVLSTYYVELNDANRAFIAIEQACRLMKILHILDIKDHLSYIQSLSQLDSEEDHYRDSLFLYERIKVMKEVEQFQCHPHSHDRKNFEVRRVHYSALTMEEFREEYMNKGVPVIIEGLLDQVVIDIEQFSLNSLIKTCGETKAHLKRLDPRCTEWARLSTSSSPSPLKDFFVAMKEGNENIHNYLFDYSLPLNMPKLNTLVTTPKYFRNNYLTRTSDHAMYRHSWPSLFVGPKGVKCGLHVDAFASHFWMTVISGVKRWTLFHKDEVVSLKPTFGSGLDPVFEASIEDELDLNPVHFNLRGGDTLFVPWGTPHRVENVESSVALSGNFVDESNINEVVRHLRRNAIGDPRAGELLKELVTLQLVDNEAQYCK